MGVKLYTLDWSPPVRAAIKKLLAKLLNFIKPKFQTKNPLHTIPVMEDGDFILHDSHAIMAYLADVYGKDESWYPKDVKKRALVNQKLFFDTSILFPRLRNTTYPLTIERNKNVDPKRYEDINEAYGFVEEFLSRSTYLAADHVTIADVAAFSNMTGMEVLLPIDPEMYPKTTSWLANMKKTSYSKKYNEPGANGLAKMIKKCLA